MGRKNHHTAESYTKNWLFDNKQLWMYRLLVSNSKVPIWSAEVPSGIGYINGFYSEELETRFGREFENNGSESIQKAIANKRLTHNDWKNMIGYLAIHDLRSIRSYVNFKNETESNLNLASKEIQNEIININLESTNILMKEIRQENIQIGLPIKIDMINNQKGVGFRIESRIGKEAFCAFINRQLDINLYHLQNIKWTILVAHDDLSWPTSDCPVVKVISSHGIYKSYGGWKYPGMVIMLPLDDKHLLMTQVKGDIPLKGTKLDYKTTFNIKKLIISNAFQEVYSRVKDDDIVIHNPRTIDKELYKRLQYEKINYDELNSKHMDEFVDDSVVFI